MTKRSDAIKKVNELISDIKTAMLVTEADNGELHSRPMITQEQEFDGDLWFFASNTSDKVREIKSKPGVNVSYVEGGKFVSISGTASIVTDVKKKKELWNEAARVWFKEGPESADVVLIRIKSQSAQYWDTPSGLIGQAVTMVQVLLTGDNDAGSDSAKVKF